MLRAKFITNEGVIWRTFKYHTEKQVRAIGRAMYKKNGTQLVLIVSTTF